MIRRLTPLLAICLLALGCSTQTTDAPGESDRPDVTPPAVQRPLRLIVVDDPQLAKLAQREWTARATRALEVIELNLAELQDAIGDDSPLDRGDAIVFPAEMLGSLAERELIQPLPRFVLENESFAGGDLALLTDVLPLVRQAQVRWGERPFVVSFGAKVLTLGYRRDILESIELGVPETFAELASALATFAAAQPTGDNWPIYGLAQPLASSWAAKTLLARAAPYCRHPGRYSALFELRTMEPSITLPDIQRALTELVNDVDPSSQESLDFDPAAAFAALARGECLFAFGWPTDLPADKASEIEIGIAEFPGSPDVYNRSTEKWELRSDNESVHVPLAFPVGRVAAVLSGSRSQKPSWSLLVHLSGRQWGSEVCSASQASGPFRNSQFANSQRWLPDLPPSLAVEYLSAISRTQQQRMFLALPRFPAASRYLTALDDAVRKSVQGSLTPQQALEQTRDSWQRITEEVGTDSQIEAYHRHLGLEP
jgi:hypothetical protein